MKIKNFRIAIVIILIQIILSLYLGLSLPADARVPSHWNLQGEIDDWSGKWTAIFLFPGINIGMLLLVIFFPSLSPRYRKDPERFQKIMPAFINILVFFFAVIHAYTLLLAREVVPSSSHFILILIGLMFVCLGNLMPKIPSNFYLGVRLPWTLSSENVWRKTHRIAGWSFSLGGVIFIIIGFVGEETSAVQIILIAAFLLIVLVPTLSAFLIYKKEQKG
ncbi:MAG: SdpI family protein [Candidatus Cloacimonadales bacterium]|nr:SdpI family protein [Candidatus Cloacimonadales bacterium]